MGDVAASLDREHEVIRHGLPPFPEARSALLRIEGAIDLDRADGSRGIPEFGVMGQAVRIEDLPPRRVGPTGNANADVASHPANFALKSFQSSPAIGNILNAPGAL